MFGVNFTTFEKWWLGIFSAIILGTTFFFSWTAPVPNFWMWLLNWVISPVSAIAGVLCVVLCAKGHINNIWWGVANSALYAIVAFVGGYLGDAAINLFFFLPTQIFIWMYWKNNLTDGVVKMKKLNAGNTIALIIFSVIAVILFALFLNGVDNFFTQIMKRSSTFYANVYTATGFKLSGPLIDSSTVILQVVAEVMLILMFAEQWFLWIAVNVITIFIWSVVIMTDPTSVAYAAPTLAMWIAFLVNSIYGAWNWYKNSTISN